MIGNCPQHITPRYTVADIEEEFASQRNQISKLEIEIKELKQKLKEQSVDEVIEEGCNNREGVIAPSAKYQRN